MNVDVLLSVILICDVCNIWCVMCDVCDLRVQGMILEMRELWHWVSACNTCHILVNSTWVVSVYWCVHWLMCCLVWYWFVMCVTFDVCDGWWVVCNVWVQGTKLDMRERWHWVSACNTCHILLNSTWVVSVYWCVHWLMCYLVWYWFVMCVTFDVWCVWCVSTDNTIGVEGAVALSQCLQHVPHLNQLDLSCECILMCALIDVLLGVILICDVCHIWCVMCVICEDREQHWRCGSEDTESVLATCATS